MTSVIIINVNQTLSYEQQTTKFTWTNAKKLPNQYFLIDHIFLLQCG